MDTLSNDRTLIIRIAAPGDASRISEIYRPYVEHTAITYEYEAPDEDEIRRRMMHTLEKYPYLVAEENGIIRGYAYAGEFKERAAYGCSVEVSIYVDQDAKGRGIGRALYTELERILLRQNILNLNACIACPKEEDEYLTKGSVRFHERMGYAMVGEFTSCACKFGRWYNMVWMEKLIGEHRENPDKVIPFPELDM